MSTKMNSPDVPVLIETTELFEKVSTGSVVTIDCRFSLDNTSEGLRKYGKSHIPGAHYAHLDNDLSSPIIPGISGRHPLPDPTTFVRKLRQYGVDQNTHIVAYDDASGAIAARAWWLCLWVGHSKVSVLNGGFNAWCKDELPLSAEHTPTGHGAINLAQPLVQALDAAEVMNEDYQLVDARDEKRFTGEHEPLDKVGGHIPGAVNLPFARNLAADSRFVSKKELQKRISPLIDQANDKTLVHYCGSGVTAAHNILAMHQIGITDSLLYAGSWSEWIQDENRSIG